MNPFQSKNVIVAAIVAILLTVTMTNQSSGAYASGTVPAGRTAPTSQQVQLSGSDIVAVHNGSWGYHEEVYSRAATKRIANSSKFDFASVLSAVLGIAGVPFAVFFQTFKAKAQDAVNTNQCFAMVKPFWGSISFPAKESWGCR